MYRLFLCLLTQLIGCSIPDLEKEEILKEAKKEAVEISDLKKEFMHGMMWLIVDENNQTFTGWVKESYQSGKIQSLGYLKNGQKEGLWLSWYEDGKIMTKCGWKKDQYSGIFKCWFQNGKLKVSGQTKEGEMDGTWEQFYVNGGKHYLSVNQIGKLVSKKVWKLDGQVCPDSNVKNGNGTFMKYDKNGTLIEIVTFKDGIFLKKINPDVRAKHE